MAKFFEMILKNTDVLQAGLMGQPWMQAVSRLLHMMRPNTRKGSRKNIYAHYDIGNDFYSRWLDPSMTYSSALFEDGINDLEQAQLRKYEEMVRRLELQPQHHVLEIGCGWGGFAEYAARNVGCRVTGITISKAQYDYAVDRIQKAGLSDRVKIELIDYRDITGTYDRIASIEMFEAVGEAWWPTFFKTLRDRLTQGGWAVMQIITIRDDRFEHYRRNPDYIQRYIFPGGMLPSKAVLKQQIEKAGLRTGESLSFGADYAKTLKLWNDRFQAAWPHLRVNGLDERFKRLWEQYLCYCQAGFATGNIDVIQIAAHKDAHRHGSIHFETTRR
jgi:cyclopropane-fatty-acyl-phospholipid synthase